MIATSQNNRDYLTVTVATFVVFSNLFFRPLVRTLRVPASPILPSTGLYFYFFPIIIFLNSSNQRRRRCEPDERLRPQRLRGRSQKCCFRSAVRRRLVPAASPLPQEVRLHCVWTFMVSTQNQSLRLGPSWVCFFYVSSVALSFGPARPGPGERRSAVLWPQPAVLSQAPPPFLTS